MLLSYPLIDHMIDAIDLLPGALPPRGHLYSLSAPETKAMNEYIQDALSTGFIRPSSSPVSAGFFFVPYNLCTHKGGKRMENSLQYPNWPLGISSHAFWFS